jgi:hypothetical protein
VHVRLVDSDAPFKVSRMLPPCATTMPPEDRAASIRHTPPRYETATAHRGLCHNHLCCGVDRYYLCTGPGSERQRQWQPDNGNKSNGGNAADRALARSNKAGPAVRRLPAIDDASHAWDSTSSGKSTKPERNFRVKHWRRHSRKSLRLASNIARTI